MIDRNLYWSRRLDEILADSPHETEVLEFKTNIYPGKSVKGEQNGEEGLIGRYLASLANSAVLQQVPKAFLILGVSDDGKITGTRFSPYEKLSNQQFLQHWLSQKLNNVDYDIHEFVYTPAHSDSAVKPAHIVLFEVNPAFPYPAAWDSIRWFRIGSSIKDMMFFPAAERKLWRLLNNSSFGMQIARSSVSAEEMLELLDVKEGLALLGISSELSQAKTLAWLQNLHLIVASGSKWDITNAGALLLANNLEDFPDLNHKRLRIVSYSGNSRIADAAEERCSRGYAVGFRTYMQSIRNIIQVSETIDLASGRRVDASEFPLLALREVLVNALIHQDITRREAPMVEIFKSRIEIISPGKARIPLLRFFGLSDKCPNPELASFMVKAKLCEGRGAGLYNAIIDCEKTCRRPPLFEALPEPSEYVRVTLYKESSLFDLSSMERLRACYQHCCICYLKGEPMSNSSLRKRFNCPASKASLVSRIIQDAQKENLIRAQDPASSLRNRRYVPFWVKDSEQQQSM